MYKEARQILDGYKGEVSELLDKEKKMMGVWYIDKRVYRLLYKGYVEVCNAIWMNKKERKVK